MCQAVTKTTLAYRKKLLAQWSRCEGVYTLKGTGNRAGEASGTFFGEAGAREWSGWSSFRGPERNELCPRAGAEGRLEAIFRAYRAGKQKQPFFFPYKTEITNAREKLLAQRRRREGVYNRTAEASVTFPGGADTRERADSPRPGGWSIADFVSARAAAEFRY